ncbi:MFS transporter [Saccharopolyspora erythraea]|uniref:MFS transporter n=1 Tax=Saccharopolyspora erythraea TaxID=1836 RepID=UPI001BA9FA44|nr:MFS transporter [Saccharopolyspora erythraea]QUH00460.1 MFS transporter [Saccharopolyspora erythraea]
MSTDALAEPRRPVRAGWTALLFVANLGLWLAFYAPIQVLLPQQAEALAPAGKEVVFGVVTGIGAAVSVVANPLAGMLSDRTTSRLGRRHPWTLGGAAAGAAGLAVLAAATDVVVMTIGWCLVQAGLNAMLASLVSALPDRVPVPQRARIGGLVGISQMLGTVAGTLVVTVLISGLTSGYLTCALLVLLAAALFVAFTPDAVLRAKPEGGIGAALRRLWVSPREHPDFAWGWGCHFMINLGNGFGTLYLLFFLGDAVHHPAPETGLLVLMGLYGAALTAGAVLAGAVSDRSGRRKPYVLLSCVLMAVAALLLAVWPTWAAALLAAPLLGAGFGIYWAVALALLTQVLPAAANRAKDLGVVNIANSLPQVVAPVLATPILAHLGGYAGLFTASALATVAAGALVTRVRGVA